MKPFILNFNSTSNSLYDFLHEAINNADGDIEFTFYERFHYQLYIPLNIPPAAMPIILCQSLVKFKSLYYVYRGIKYYFTHLGYGRYKMCIGGTAIQTNGIYINEDSTGNIDTLSIGFHPKVKVDGFKLLDFIRKTDNILSIVTNKVYYKGFLYDYNDKYLQHSDNCTVVGTPIIKENLTVNDYEVELTNKNISILQKHLGRMYSNVIDIPEPPLPIFTESKMLDNQFFIADGIKCITEQNFLRKLKDIYYGEFNYDIDLFDALFGFKCVFTNQITSKVIKKHPFVFKYKDFIDIFTNTEPFFKESSIINFIHKYHIVL